MRVEGHEGTTEPVDAAGLRVAVITSVFNQTITDGLERGAVGWLLEVGAEVSTFSSPGAFELPLFAQRCALAGFDAVVCLGAVIEGDTDHYEHVAHRASEGLMRVQLDTGVPVSFGILTVRDIQDAVVRSGDDDKNKGKEAASAAVNAAMVLRSIGSG
jgi:6,7-dimethyl-8-ribityllumazine synthase